MKSRLNTEWFRNRTDKEKSDLIYLISNNTILIEAFLEILTRYENEEVRAEISADQYDNPSWAYKQADHNGARRAFNKVRSLFKMETSH